VESWPLHKQKCQMAQVVSTAADASPSSEVSCSSVQRHGDLRQNAAAGHPTELDQGHQVDAPKVALTGDPAHSVPLGLPSLGEPRSSLLQQGLAQHRRLSDRPVELGGGLGKGKEEQPKGEGKA